VSDRDTSWDPLIGAVVLGLCIGTAIGLFFGAVQVLAWLVGPA
jgi:uncharacterized membrane protein